MTTTIENLEPKLVWQHFHQLTQIPRPSAKEAKVRDHLKQWADKKEYSHQTDAAGNLVIKVPASPGHEDKPIIMLQAHMDMVCERDPDSKINPETDPLETFIKDGWVGARGTTLGADNGIGLSAALAVADDASAIHPPLELILTVEEETGLIGAFNFDASTVQGKKLINIDGGTKTLLIGCAGGINTLVKLPVERQSHQGNGEAYAIKIGGLIGGHSSGDIHRNRGNANKVVTRFLVRLGQTLPFELIDLQGGDKMNAIPRHATAVITLPANQIDKLQTSCSEFQEQLREEFSGIDDGIQISCEPLSEKQAPPLTKQDQDRLLHLMNSLPNGLHALNRFRPDRAETSTNFAVVKLHENHAEIANYHRALFESAIEDLTSRLRSTATLANATVTTSSSFPGWLGSADTPLAKLAASCYEELFDEPIDTKIVHGAIECTAFAKKIKDIDMVSIGPNLEDPHSPTERVEIASVERLYKFLKAILAASV